MGAEQDLERLQNIGMILVRPVVGGKVEVVFGQPQSGKLLGWSSSRTAELIVYVKRDNINVIGRSAILADDGALCVFRKSEQHVCMNGGWTVSLFAPVKHGFLEKLRKEFVLEVGHHHGAWYFDKQGFQNK